MSDPFLWFRDKDSVQIGGVRRYTIKYKPAEPTSHIYLRLKNIEKTSIRAIHLLNGPFILYCHVIPVNYDHTKEFKETERELHFNNSLKPGQTFNVKLLLNENSKLSNEDETYSWNVDIISQIVITSGTSVAYDLMVGSDLENMKKLNHGSLRVLSSLSPTGQGEMELNRSVNPRLEVEKTTEEELWSRPPDYDKSVHLVILTHGIFSNLTADMLYLKETMEQNVHDNLLIKGFNGNAGKTEGGIKKLGSKQGKFLMKLINNLIDQGIKVTKISFVGHSLGGLTQLYSIKFILDNDPHFFTSRNIKPHNLVFMASPLLGILNEISFFLSWLLDLGTLGKTGRDLTLTKSKLKGKAVLEQLPDQLHQFMKSCENLIIYANIINDGIVPLRTGALLYLDYTTLDNVKDLKRENENGNHDSVGEVPVAAKNKDKLHVIDKYRQFVSLNFNVYGDKKREKVRKKILRINAKGSDKQKSDQVVGVEAHKDKASNKGDDDVDESLAEQRDNDSIEMGQDEAETVDLNSTEDEFPSLHIPPKASIVESAINTILCPIPNQKFLVDPSCRRSTIFHDKFYHHEDLPEEKDETSFFNKAKKQVKIARKYHDELNWRKILVRLPADAHNNINVRRRFPNGYGWGVVDHLCELFNESLIEKNEPSARPSQALEKIKSKI